MAEHQAPHHSLGGAIVAARCHRQRSPYPIKTADSIRQGQRRNQCRASALPLGTQQWPHPSRPRSDGQLWTQGVLGHSHGICVLTDQGVVQNHINGFIVDNGEAACIWKIRTVTSIWLCQPSSGESNTHSGRASMDQWTGRLASEPQVTYECPNGDPSSSEKPPSKGCQSLPQGRKTILLILLGCVALTRRNNRDNGALSSQ